MSNSDTKRRKAKKTAQWKARELERLSSIKVYGGARCGGRRRVVIMGNPGVAEDRLRKQIETAIKGQFDVISFDEVTQIDDKAWYGRDLRAFAPARRPGEGNE